MAKKPPKAQRGSFKDIAAGFRETKPKKASTKKPKFLKRSQKGKK